MKKSGFSVIEVMVIIGIVGVLLSLSVTSYRGWRSQSVFLETSDRLLEMFTTARVNALSEKKCRSGDTAQKWILQINTDTSKNFRLFCNDTNASNLEEPNFESDTEYTFVESILTASLYVDGALTTVPQVESEFFSGKFVSRINSDFSYSSFRVDLQALTNVNFQKTICFYKDSGYAYISKTFGTCEE